MDNSKKKDQNKSYYLRNKEKILERARKRSEDVQVSEIIQDLPEKPIIFQKVVSLFESPKASPTVKAENMHLHEQSREKPLSRFHLLEMGLLFILASTITGYLIHESAKFFFETDGNQPAAIVKALILEGAAVAFSLLRGRTFWNRVVFRLMVVLIYAFGLCVVSGPVLSSAIHQQNESALQQKRVQELETEIRKKEGMRDRYWKEDRTTLARRYDQALDALRTTLDTERRCLSKHPVKTSATIFSGFW